MKGRPTWRALVVSLAVAAFLAVAIAPFASSSPDGLEKVAIDEGFIATAQDHDLAAGPLAGYAVDGVDNERVTVSLAGLVGLVVTFAITAGLVALARRRQRSDAEPQPV